VKNRDGSFSLADFEANPHTVTPALDSIRTHTHLSANHTSPSWLPQASDRPPALELLPCKSMTLHIPSGTVLEPTPLLFNTNALEFDYDANAPTPTRWLGFLDELLGADAESKQLLQEWAGYCLTGDTSLQKMLLIVGPRRSGKGTIGRVLTELVGAGNVAGPTTGSLAGTFGLQTLIGKSLAIVSDARFSGENVATVVERLLCIVGEDSLSIDRKYLGAVTMKLSTRFTFLTNELPRLADSSNALTGRFLVLRLQRSFYGKEDTGLTRALISELPGILRWALEGWKRLQATRRFTQPASSAAAIEELEDLGSPVGAFIRERCVLGAGHRVWVDDLYAAWRQWCETEGRSQISNKQAFGRDLQAAEASVVRRRGSGQIGFYEGIGLRGVDTM
jgi:putative DNA primase/helicase